MKRISVCGKQYLKLIMLVLISMYIFGCTKNNETSVNSIKPIVITEPVIVDSDDPAIWIHPDDPAKSIVLGTDKGGNLFAFDLDGKIIKSATGYQRFNNVDVEYGLMLNGKPIDIAVTTDRDAKMFHVFSLPDLTQIDGGGIPAFEGEEFGRPMGMAIYKRPADGAFFAVASRKQGPSGSYLWQYRLEDDGVGNVKFTKVRAFGDWSGIDDAGDGEIEAVAIDDDLGYIYYSDEVSGIRKYQADPDAPDANVELAHFGTKGFASDREGISIYKTGESTGYILVSDQQANAFRIFPREGDGENPHKHPLLKVVHVFTNGSDGSEVTNVALNSNFPKGLFVAMSDDKTFQFYSWTDIVGDDLKVEPNGELESTE